MRVTDPAEIYRLEQKAKRRTAPAPALTPTYILGVDPGSDHSGASLIEVTPYTSFETRTRLLAGWEILTGATEECSARKGPRASSRGEQRLRRAVDVLREARGLAHGPVMIVLERCPVTARGDSGRAGSQALIGWALGRCAGLWETLAAQQGIPYDEIEVGPSVRRWDGKAWRRQRGGWRAAFPGLHGGMELKLVRALWPEVTVTSEHVASAALIGAGWGIIGVDK